MDEARKGDGPKFSLKLQLKQKVVIRCRASEIHPDSQRERSFRMRFIHAKAAAAAAAPADGYLWKLFSS